MAAVNNTLEQALPMVQHNGLNTNKNITVGGTANVDMSGSTGTFSTPSGAVTLSGDSTFSGNISISGAGTFESGTGTFRVKVAPAVRTGTLSSVVGGELALMLGTTTTSGLGIYIGSGAPTKTAAR